ncbi:TetR/AcrR family transcriptional regulator C-terminal domain-containing protein [Gordonibacter sp.]|uniref:TetR/AcrR family transcriptional regulator C-terminal domain-containing protein n=1 Tax=Gordonibacter sp. TaxID=1968902 RepID=UPI002FC8CED0
MQNPKTKTKIADTFIKLAESEDPLKISVRTVSEVLGVNRKTFYYYFQSKELLVNWIFRRDLGHKLKDSFPQSKLLFEEKDSTPYSQYPYYVFIEEATGYLNHDVFFLELSRCFGKRRNFYAQILKTTEIGSLRAYMFSLYNEALKKDILYIFRGVDLSQTAIDFLAEFYAAAFLGQISNRIINSANCRSLNDVNPYNNIIHGSLGLLKNHLLSGAISDHQGNATFLESKQIEAR